AGEGASEMLARAMENANRPYANVGVAALKLFAAMATALGDAKTHDQAIVLAAERDTEDDALVIEADQAVRANTEDAALIQGAAKKLPPARRVAAYRASARALSARGAHAEAAAALERAAELADAQGKTEVEFELRAAYEAAGRGHEIEARAQREAQ